MSNKGTITKSVHGYIPRREGEGEGEVEVSLYTLCNGRLRLQCSTYGATITSLTLPAPTETHTETEREEVTLCHASFERLFAMKGRPYYGCVAGRVANRIARGQFHLDESSFQLAVNNGVNHLHGGNVGFNQRVWEAREVVEEGEEGRVGVVFHYLSVDGEENYPGNLDVQVGYYLTASDDLVIEYYATTDAPTILNLTNHTYWNLSGNFKDKILGHHLQLNCGRYLPVDNTQIPTGELRAVVDDPLFDFTGEGKSLRDSVLNIDGCGRPGIDHCFVIDKSDESSMAYLGCLSHAESGRRMEVYTTHPGVQIYTGNWLNIDESPENQPHVIHNAMCLETQHFPDSINKPHFPTVILRPGETYKHTSKFSFRTTK